MCKSAVRLFSLFLCGICVLWLSGCDSLKAPVIITELNKPYENANYKIEFTEIHISEEPNENADEDLEIYAKYVIENLSNTEISFSRFDMQTYADDLLVDKTGSSVSLAPEKKAELEHSVQVPKDAQQVEFYFYDPDTSTHIATFIFDVSSIEKAPY